MAWYDTGTVSVTNGSTTVTGSGTNFVSGAQVGEGFYGPDGRLYEIQAIVSATSLTLADSYLGTTQSGQAYKIVPTQSLVANLASQVSTLISDFQTVADEAGEGKFADGSAASPGITFTQDQDTGFFRDTANEIGISIGGTKKAEFNSTGLQFEDNSKAIFGAGSDLQIYHDGLNSVIADAGTGNLLLTANDFRLQNTTQTQNMISANDDGAVGLFYNGSQKLATTSTGVDVTGTVTADGLTVSAGAASVVLEDNTSGQPTSIANVTFKYNAGTLGFVGYDGASSGALEVWNTYNGNVIFGTNNTERMRIDSSGNVGIGTSSPSYRLSLGTGTGRKFSVYDLSGTASGLGVDMSGSGYELSFWSGNSAGGVGQFSWGQVNTTTGAYSEKMRLDASGNLLVGTTTSYPGVSGLGGNIKGLMSEGGGTLFLSRVDSNPVLYVNRGGTDGDIVRFSKDATTVGSISVTSSATAYNTSSDYRLKEDVQPMVGASDRVLALNPVNFAWKSDGSRVDGFLAHEAQAVVPEAVTGTKDEVDADGKPVYQGIDQSKLVPLLTAALQEALKRIEALEAQLNP